MRQQIKTLFLGVLVLGLTGFGLVFYQSLNKTIPSLRISQEASLASLVPPANNLPTNTNFIKVIVGTSTTLNLELATSTEKRMQGLSGHESLDINAGMLFVFDQPDRYGFWMKEMNFPLDLIWLNNEGKVIAIDAAVPANSYPKIFYPPTPIKYVMEANANWAAAHQLEVGDILQPLNF
ncbi:MAG: DUF192 domain-containing protein [bacterium]|nr:DUF192 domain-containing protein [bacterium]